ncbi:MAG: hypothetical protein K2X27_15115 [Candidatus Obscuribacterales bacterium]|nr:hypothetical protein [Candidatus Obscuribacterales bacterium]
MIFEGMSSTTFRLSAVSLLLSFCCSMPRTSADPSSTGDAYVDDLMTTAVESQSPYWSEVKAQLTNGNIDQALKLCRSVLARRELDIDMHCLYAMALEMKLRSSEHDTNLFNECVKEWTHVAKVKILAASKGWEHVGDGEVFLENQQRKKLANRHLVALVGRAPKYFESEEAFLAKTIRVETQVAGKIRKDKEL